MTTHITARMAWHDNGWNGQICKNPECNSYCVGKHSYPADIIAKERNLDKEKIIASFDISTLKDEDLPPCTYSVNAFGTQQIKGYSKPPVFIEADKKTWNVPAATISIWPYEDMFSDEVKQANNGTWDNNKRVAKADEFFQQIEIDKSLIFYYANYANPLVDLSEDEHPKYLLVGVSKIKEIGENKYYDNPTDNTRERYADARIWARDITSHFPKEGFCIPYHRYLDNPETLKKIAVHPDNPILCKYITKHINDDDAIGLLEQLLHCVIHLQEIEGTQENWKERAEWLNQQIVLLWKKRGLHPGLLNIMNTLEATKAIIPAKKLMDNGQSKEAHDMFFDSLNNETNCLGLQLQGKEFKEVCRQWQLLDLDERDFIKNILSRLALDNSAMQNILSAEKREKHGITNSIKELSENPYIICEKYVGEETRDFIPWSVIDRGVFPSPELGGDIINDIKNDHPNRLRSLCIEQLKREPNHAFREAEEIKAEVNERLEYLHTWKQTELKDRHFEVDKEIFDKGLKIKKIDDKLVLYIQDV
ncbi:MAG: exonuclease, partial [Endozoicomonadaceae bacterium]|nr:exonuclease [Endozoicomonadaceae bacterium]